MRNFRKGPAGLVFAAVGVASAFAVSPATAMPVPRETFTASASGQFTVRGLGFGHGHGMSQYGAKGAAEQGLTAAQIVAFYYPGAKLASVGGTAIRVQITGSPANALEVAAANGLQLRSVGTGVVYGLPTRAGLTRWRLTPSGGHTVVSYLDGGGWHQWTAPTGAKYLASQGEFFAPNSAVSVVTNQGVAPYRGTVRLASDPSGSWPTVNYVGLDDYLRGVVPSEMPANWPTAAVQAQAIAARTYALAGKAASGARPFDTCDTTACQVYAGVRAEQPASNAAVAATAGRYLTYGGAPAYAQFSSSNGGWESAGGRPYLPSKADPYDKYAGWTSQISNAAVQAAHPEIGKLAEIGVVSRDGGGAFGGRVQQILLTGSNGQTLISGDAFAGMLRLRSDLFTIDALTPVAAAPGGPARNAPAPKAKWKRPVPEATTRTAKTTIKTVKAKRR